MHIIIEKNIPYIKGLLEPYGSVEYLAADEIGAKHVKEADALFVRTRTRCDAALLAGSKCRFVGTATIGTDHIDMPWCAANGVEVANAPGCNAPAVAQYVMSSILSLIFRSLHQHTIGIVGVGHVGSIVERWARGMDMNVLVCDPPREEAEGGLWSTLEEIAEKCDIITFHTPLDATTRHMADADFFNSLRRSPIIINAARGPVVDNAALVDALDKGLVHHAVIDCWEGEPNISPALLSRAAIATPHIAGYSREGKTRATRMVLDAFSKCFGLPRIDMEVETPAEPPYSVSPNAVINSYDPLADTAMLKAHPDKFEELRNNYSLRPEAQEE